MTEKEFYTSPEVNVFKVQTEGVICQSGYDADSILPGILEDWGVF